jgi:hypothetical protein
MPKQTLNQAWCGNRAECGWQEGAWAAAKHFAVLVLVVIISTSTSSAK